MLFAPALFRFLLSCVAASLFSVQLQAQADKDAVLGTWLNGEKQAKIRIYQCGDKYCGKIVWLGSPTENGKPRTDINNPDEQLRDQPIVGLRLLRDFTHQGGKVWEDGEVYDPRNGKTYSCKLTLVNPDKLDVRGYIGFSFIGKTDTWTRAE